MMLTGFTFLTLRTIWPNAYQTFQKTVEVSTIFAFSSVLETEESHIILLRLRNQAGSWVWLHSYGQRVTLENSEEEMVFTHTIAR